MAFAAAPRAAALRVLLVASSEAGDADTARRIERLAMLDGAGRAALVVLMQGRGSVDALTRLQLE